MVNNTTNHHLLITGGCGFIGLNLVNFLLKKTSWKINILDNLSTGSLNNLKTITHNSRRIKFIKGDICRKKDIKKAIANCDYIVHLAAKTGVILSQNYPHIDAQTNIIGTLNLLEIAKKNKINKFIFASSGAPLGKQKMPIHEKKVPQPQAPYGASKLAGEAYCSAFAHSFGIPCIVLRFSNIYGPWSNHKESAIHKFIKKIITKESITLYGNGKFTRDFIYVNDVCKAILQALIYQQTSAFELFHIGSGRETSLNKLVIQMQSVFRAKGYSVNVIKDKSIRKGEIERNYANITHAKEKLNFSPKYSLQKGLKKTINWYLRQNK